SPQDARHARRCRGLLALLAACAAVLASSASGLALPPVVVISPADEPATPRRPALWLGRAPASPGAEPAVRPALLLEPDEDAATFAVPAARPRISQVVFQEDDGPALEPEVVSRPPALLPVSDEGDLIIVLQPGAASQDDAEKS